jgi:hypothetical protein
MPRITEGRGILLYMPSREDVTFRTTYYCTRFERLTTQGDTLLTAPFYEPEFGRFRHRSMIFPNLAQ